MNTNINMNVENKMDQYTQDTVVKCKNEIVCDAKLGKEIYPLFYINYSRAVVSEAIEMAYNDGLLTHGGLDITENVYWVFNHNSLDDHASEYLQ